MKDPREYPTGMIWSFSHDAGGLGNQEVFTLLHDDICARLDAKDAEVAALRRALAYWPPCNCNQPESIADFSGEPQKQCPRCSLPADVQEIVNCATKTTNERTNP